MKTVIKSFQTQDLQEWSSYSLLGIISKMIGANQPLNDIQTLELIFPNDDFAVPVFVLEDLRYIAHHDIEINISVRPAHAHTLSIAVVISDDF